MILLRCHRLGQFIALCDNAATFAPTLWEFEVLPFLTGTWALQDIDIEICKLCIVEVEVCRTIRIGVQKVCTSPVQHRHEVIADAVDALCREVTQTFLVNLDLVVSVWTAILDCLNDRKALYNAPAHTITLDIRLQVVYLLTCPYLTERYIVQGCYNAFYSDLS